MGNFQKVNLYCILKVFSVLNIAYVVSSLSHWNNFSTSVGYVLRGSIKKKNNVDIIRISVIKNTYTVQLLSLQFLQFSSKKRIYY